MDVNLFIYILRLESNKYYIGKTENLFKRFDDHRSGLPRLGLKNINPYLLNEL